MGTNQGFKKFVLLLAVFTVVSVLGAKAGQGLTPLHYFRPDTIPVEVRNENHAEMYEQTLIDAIARPLIINADTVLPAFNNVSPEDTASVMRHRGSGTILDTRVDYSAADSIFFDVRERKVFLFGNAELKYGAIQLTAGFVEIDFRRNELYASAFPDSAGVLQGRPVFTEEPQSFQSEEMWYNFQTRRGRTKNVFTEEAEGFLHGELVKIQPNRIIHVQDGKFTTCNDPEPHFHIGFRRAKIIPDDKIITSLAFLVIHGVPTPLIVPFGFFPNKRGQASGILMPSYGETANRGFYLENGGFYLGLNEYVDLSVRGDIYTRGSWAAKLGSNYRVRYRYNGSLNLTYAINILGEKDLPGYERNRDFRVQWSHNQDPKARPNSVFRANVNAGSTQSTRFNPVSDTDYLSNTFSSNVTYMANWAGRYNFSVNLRHSQNTLNRSVDLSLPEIAFSVNRLHPFRRKERTGQLRWYEDITLNYSMNARNELRTTDSLLFKKETWDEMRNGVRHSIPISHSFRVLRHFNLSNSFNYNMNWYLSTINRYFDPQAMVVQRGDTLFGAVITDTVPGFKIFHEFSYNTSLNTRFYGLMQFRKGPLRAVRHVVSPSISFNFRPDFANPFWGYYKSFYNPRTNRDVQYAVFEGGIYGGPAPNRSGSINFSLTNNLELKVRNQRDTVGRGESKITIFENLSISGGYDLARDSINFSDISISARTRLFDNFDITYGSSWTVYQLDSMGRYINRFIWEDKPKLLQLNNTTWTFSFNYTLSSKARPSAGAGGQGRGIMPPMPGANPLAEGGTEDPPEEMNQVRQPLSPGQINFAVPWNLQFSYTFNYGSRYDFRNEKFERTIIQSLNFSGDFYLTPKWRIGFRSGYDFKQNQITYTSVDIYRDLHCWEMTLNWIPFGFRKSYNFTIRVKSQVLQDLKLTRRTHHLDRAFQTF